MYFKNFLLTKKGKEMLLNSNNNTNGKLLFTKAKVGSGRLNLDNIENATSISNAWKELEINTVRMDLSGDEPKLYIEITFTNEGIEEAIILSECGIYATNEKNEEILFAYSVTELTVGEEILIQPVLEFPTSFKIRIESIISNDTDIQNTINCDGFLTAEVIELLKQNINNIAIQRIQGTLTENQKIITFDKTSLLNVISNRLQLFIAGELMSLNIDYTVDTGSNRIILADEYNFPNGTVYEVIDPLPPTYVKEEIDKFYKSVEEKTKESLEKLKNKEEKTLTIIDEKKDSSIVEIDEHVKEHLQNLIGEKGEAGRGIESFEYISTSGTTKLYRVTYTDKTTTDLYISDGANGDSAYEIATSNGFEGTEEEWLESLKGIQGNEGTGIKEITFDRANEQGDYIYNIIKDNEELAGEIISPRGPIGPKGDIELAYGIVVEYPVTAPLPRGWVYTNGTTISKVKYPHMADMLPTVTAPQVPYFALDDTTKKIRDVTAGNLYGTSYEYPHIKNKDVLFYGIPIYDGNPFMTSPEYLIKFSGGNYKPLQGRYVGFNKEVYRLYLPIAEELFLSFLEIDIENMKGNNANVEHGNDFGTQNVDWYLKIEALDSNGRFKPIAELHNKTDFFPVGGESKRAFHMFSDGIKTREYRISIMEKSTPNIIHSSDNPLYFIGKLRFGFDKNACQLDELMVLPDIKDSLGNYKIMYVGSPLGSSSFSMSSYAKDNTYNGEIPFSLASNNELPNYSEGITMSIPNKAKLGYINKYNIELDVWELIKTHENKEGYYYDETGELKYISKRNNYSEWDNTENKWIINLEKKNIEKYKLQSKLIELEIKKEKFVEKEFDIVEIEKELENIKSQLKEVNDESETEVL